MTCQCASQGENLGMTTLGSAPHSLAQRSQVQLALSTGESVPPRNRVITTTRAEKRPSIRTASSRYDPRTRVAHPRCRPSRLEPCQYETEGVLDADRVGWWWWR